MVRLNDCAVSVQLNHRRLVGGLEPVLVMVSAPVPLSVQDVAATLFFCPAVTYEELADDEFVRQLVADSVVYAGSAGLEAARCEAAQVDPGTGAAAFLAYCRARAAAVFTPTRAATGRAGDEVARQWGETVAC